MSLDGRTAAADGSSRWITSEDARADAHRLRAWADAVAVGAGTAVADDPALTVRGDAAKDARPPLRVLIDSAGRAPAGGAIVGPEAPTLVATTDRMPDAVADTWARAGAEVAALRAEPDGRVALPSLLEHLGKRDVQGLLVEGGATLAWSFLRDDLVDRVVTYIAPSIVGGAVASGAVGGDGFTPVTSARRLTSPRVTHVGADLKMESDVHRDR
jgi:diaminohydroxyphosphoribosylaminopyrimidine deaminase/5-amino-6-(5-phosphoribosylamino)uracil reductase